ncbi:LysR family transcriptional regulator [Pacificoceanicola onchidii]|uniref:LysR family transcriptional regulator n=1 Tax=Pacificoceanicola onchidii TaxID=2562685 RepID=UPI0010A4BA78|nr:LysR family transcriptional regulator [Pacificoceanicola onchidii]
MEPQWDDLRTVLALVRGKTLAAAAEALGVNYTTVARRVSRLETALGLTLFERLADGYQPTEAGLRVAERAAAMAAETDSLLRQLAGADARLSGPLTITAPQLLIAHVLAPSLKRFRETYPDVSLQVRATNDLLDLTRREADVAIRVSRAPGDTLKGLRLTEQHTASFATKDWADRIRDDPKGPHDWILFADHSDLPKSVQSAYPGARVRYRFDDMIAMAGAAQAGLGIVRMPMFLGRALPGLVQVPCLPPQSYADIWIVAHPDVWTGARVKAFRDILVPDMKTARPLFVA